MHEPQSAIPAGSSTVVEEYSLQDNLIVNIGSVTMVPVATSSIGKERMR